MALEKAMKYCGYCLHSRIIGERGQVQCRHPIHEESLKTGERGKNPIWAERKFAPLGTLMKLTSFVKRSGMQGPGTNKDDMAFDDGADCKVWKRKP